MAAAVIGLLVAGFLLRSIHGKFDHTDEILVLKAVENMAALDQFDTNWRLIEGMPKYFKCDLYDFSSYFYTSYFFYRLARPIVERFRDGPWNMLVTRALLRMFSAFFGTLIVLGVFLTVRSVTGSTGAAVLGLMTALVNPLLVQDSHYARPDTFITLGALLVVTTTLRASRSERPAPWVALSFLVLGYLIASKVTLAVFGAAAVIPLVKTLLSGTARRQRFELLMLIGAASLLAGLFAGMPYAFFNPDAFMNGILYLRYVYANPYPPQGAPDGSLLFWYITVYFYQTFGLPLSLLFLAGLFGMVRNRSYLLLLACGIPVVVFYVVFSVQQTFFERNLSPIVPLMIVISTYGAWYLWKNALPRLVHNRAVRTSVAFVLVPAFLYVPASVSHKFVFGVLSGEHERDMKKYEQKLLDPYRDLPVREEYLFDDTLLKGMQEILEHAGGGPVIIKVRDFNDEFAGRYLALLRKKFAVKEIGWFPGPFEDMQTSTLHVYGGFGMKYYLVSEKSGETM